ncbi:hypothetical protein BGZ51_002044 [Haplosporangium sp. Z 767]|nr:hypothetical protein BGZ51_002044 [Haplosporangium sp. Z 767]
MATFAIVAQAQDGGEITKGFDRYSGDVGGTFKDTGYNALSALAQGPYPSTFNAVRAMPPIVAVGGDLEKRQSGCPSGYGSCGNGKCCPTDQLCSVAAGGCCEKDYPYTCGGLYCCPYKSCTSDGRCGCSSATQTRCGDKCCYYGCTAGGSECACPSTHPTACSDNKTCCEAGATCIGNGMCRGGSGGSPPPTFTTTSQPQPTKGSGGSGSNGSGSNGSGSGGSGSGGSGSGGSGGEIFLPDAAPSSMERSSGAVAALLAMAAVFVAA